MYDPLDPMTWFERTTYDRTPPAQGPKVPTLAKEEEESLLSRAAGAGLGGIGYAGSVLEKTLGGRAIRGLLGGKPRELLSVIPLSDTLEITDEKDRVSGRELLRNAGIAGSEDNWGNFLGGLGLELATDPGMYASFGAGALTKAGQVAKKAGVLPATTAGRVRGTLASLAPEAQTKLAEWAARTGTDLAAHTGPLGYSVGFGLPFASPAFGLGESGLQIAGGVGKVLGFGHQLAKKVPFLGTQYGHVTDLGAKALDWTGRQARALFDPEVLEATSRAGQESARDARPVIRALEEKMRGKAADYAKQLEAAGMKDIDPSGELLRSLAEKTYDAQKLGAPHPVMESVARGMRSDLEETLSALRGLGIDVTKLSDQEIEYLPRYLTPLLKPTRGYSSPRQALAVTDPRVSGRSDVLKEVPGGTATLNKLAVDQEVQANNMVAAATHIRRNYLGMGGQVDNAGLTVAERQLIDLNRMTPAQLDAAGPAWKQLKAELTRKSKHADELAIWARGLDPQYAASGAAGQTPLRVFGNHPLTDFENYFGKVSRLMGAGEATQNLLARTAMDVGPFAPGSLPLTKALEQLGLTAEGAQPTLINRLNATRAERGLAPIQVGELGNFQVGKDVLGDAGRYLKGFQAPEAVSNVGGAIDYLTNMTKAFQTAMWPAFHARNLASGMWMNWVKGMGESPGGYLKQVQDAYKLVTGKVIPDMHMIPEFQRLGYTPEQATQAIARELYQYKVGGHLPNIAREVVGPYGTAVNAGTDLPGFLSRIPGEAPVTPGQAWQTYRGVRPGQTVSWDPRNISGAAANADLFPLIAGGRQAGDIIEGVNRNSLYLGLRRQGYSAEQAGKEVLKAHFDYTRGAKTNFEADFMSRMVPFYTFSRKNIPETLEQLVTRPGGPAGTMARVAEDLRQDAGFLPDYMGSGLAIPLAPESEGKRSYLSRLDLPPEQAFEMLKGGTKGAQIS